MTEPKRKDREFRQFAEFELKAEDKELYVEGYAATFNEQTVLYEDKGIEYKEQIDPSAFNDADFSDVIFNYNHGGKVMARTRNQTLQLNTDQNGLYVRARLDGTDEGRRLYEEIKGGYIDRMSFAFTVQESSYNKDEHTRTVKKVKKVYDVSAVDIPAYDTTSISARSFFEAEAEKEREMEFIAQRKLKLKIKTLI